MFGGAQTVSGGIEKKYGTICPELRSGPSWPLSFGNTPQADPCGVGSAYGFSNILCDCSMPSFSIFNPSSRLLASRLTTWRKRRSRVVVVQDEGGGPSSPHFTTPENDELSALSDGYQPNPIDYEKSIDALVGLLVDLPPSLAISIPEPPSRRDAISKGSRPPYHDALPGIIQVLGRDELVHIRDEDSVVGETVTAAVPNIHVASLLSLESTGIRLTSSSALIKTCNDTELPYMAAIQTSSSSSSTSSSASSISGPSVESSTSSLLSITNTLNQDSRSSSPSEWSSLGTKTHIINSEVSSLVSPSSSLATLGTDVVSGSDKPTSTLPLHETESETSALSISPWDHQEGKPHPLASIPARKRAIFRRRSIFSTSPKPQTPLRLLIGSRIHNPQIYTTPTNLSLQQPAVPNCNLSTPAISYPHSTHCLPLGHFMDPFSDDLEYWDILEDYFQDLPDLPLLEEAPFHPPRFIYTDTNFGAEVPTSPHCNPLIV
ncbi:hypothetical protein JAAARDRAFT_690750 [Jaapia argillacea MUCL 33604]|uniref:Uncharacterized protein n=1 Tax=Jaapia argillacea MUCL 33604 TaxID=933084 RepID=A0A067PZY3_9AGAM|nr:hypothetical protein JAAARDRAFT_690750 [Jaapia argillacea MUCL 33604]